MEKEQMKISYKLVYFNTIRFNYSEPKRESIKIVEENPSQINFLNNPLISVDVDKNLVIVDFTITTSIIDTKETISEIQTIFYFEVVDLKDYAEVVENQIKFKKDGMRTFLITITGASYSTMRGIMFEKFKSSSLPLAFLPITNPASFFKPEEPHEKKPDDGVDDVPLK